MPTLQAVRRAAEQSGVVIVEGCEVANILFESSRVVGVESAGQRHAVPQVLVATSAWGAAQLNRMGINMPVHPHRAEMAFFQVPPSGDFALRRIVSDARSMLYLRPEGDRQLFVGWREGDRVGDVGDMIAEDPDDDRQTARYESLADMSARLAATLPPMRNGFVHRTYPCVYDYTPDGMPILDRADEVQGLYVAMGFSGGGFSLSPWVGRTMADFIATGKQPAEIERLDARRFAENRLINWDNVKA